MSASRSGVDAGRETVSSQTLPKVLAYPVRKCGGIAFRAIPDVGEEAFFQDRFFRRQGVKSRLKTVELPAGRVGGSRLGLGCLRPKPGLHRFRHKARQRAALVLGEPFHGDGDLLRDRRFDAALSHGSCSSKLGPPPGRAGVVFGLIAGVGFGGRPTGG